MGAGRVAGMSLVPALLGLAACAPTPEANTRLPLEEAQRACLRPALEADGSRANSRVANPRVNVGIGIGGGSWRGGYGSVGISTDAPLGRQRDPDEIYRDCVIRRSGQVPNRSFYDQLGARAT